MVRKYIDVIMDGTRCFEKMKRVATITQKIIYKDQCFSSSENSKRETDSVLLFGVFARSV